MRHAELFFVEFRYTRYGRNRRTAGKTFRSKPSFSLFLSTLCFALCSRGFFNYPDRIFFLFFSFVPLDFPTLTSPIFKLGWLRQGRGRRQKGGSRLSIYSSILSRRQISPHVRANLRIANLYKCVNTHLSSAAIYVYIGKMCSGSRTNYLSFIDSLTESKSLFPWRECRAKLSFIAILQLSALDFFLNYFFSREISNL